MIKFILFLLFSTQAAANEWRQPQTITTEEEVVQVLTGIREFKGIKILERKSQKSKQLVREYLSEKLQGYGYKPELQTYSPTGTNVFSLLPSTTGSKQFVVVGAHFDSVGNAGANDNASGVSIVMSMADQLIHQTQRDKNVLFCFFDEEESGLLGSKAFAKKLMAEKLLIHSAHTVDQLAYDADGDFAIELEAATPELLNFYRTVNFEQKFNLILETSPVTTTDHDSFRKLGIPSIGVTEEYYHDDTTSCYHQKCDTYDTINFEYLYSGSRFWTAVIGTLIK